MTLQETDPGLLVGVWETLAKALIGGGLLQGSGTDCSSACMGSFEGVTIIFITSTIVWPQVNSWEGTQFHPSTEN